MGLDARAYLIRVERRLMQFHCSAPGGAAALDAEHAAE
ncbi:hypothetical protein M2351_008468 [Azospirillum canadense]|nr:hypothetical protein [Azospirillum canadense]